MTEWEKKCVYRVIVENKPAVYIQSSSCFSKCVYEVYVYPPVCECSHINTVCMFTCVCVCVCVFCLDVGLWFMDIHYRAITAEVTRDRGMFYLLMHKTQSHTHTRVHISWHLGIESIYHPARRIDSRLRDAAHSDMMRNKSPKHIHICCRYFPPQLNHWKSRPQITASQVREGGSLVIELY